MKTLSQQTLNDLIFGRIFIIICAQIVLLLFATTYGNMPAQDLDTATLVNIFAIMSCIAMFNAVRKEFSSIYQSIIVFLFDSLYVFLLIAISGRSCSPFIILLPLYIFFSTLSLKTTGAIISSTLSVVLIFWDKLWPSLQDCYVDKTFITASIIIVFTLLCDSIVRREYKRKNAKFKEIQLRNSEKELLLDNVVSILAHEIKNPVSSLSGVADLIRSDEKMLDNPEQRQKLLGIISREATRLANLTEEFLIYSGSEKRRNERIELDALVQISCESVRAQKDFIDKKITLDFHSQNGPHITYGDFHRLEQAFTNILVNSVQACNENGKTQCNVITNNDEIIVVISNNGEKIPPLVIERMFDPFFTTKDKGTGLGLAIVKNIIKAHDGDIQVQSTDDETSFKMRFKLWQ